MRVLITGGAGFLGSHLCDYFLEKDFEVVCVDNFITGMPDNIKHLSGNPSFTFVEQDIIDKFTVDGPLDYVLNFASPASPVDYMEHPIETLRVGSLGTQNMLELAKEKNARFLQASTSEVYGDPDVSPQTEGYLGNVNPIGVRAVYDEAKRYGEAITMAFHRYFDVNTGIVRIFNTYGPRMRQNDGRAVPQFISQALEGKPITVYGDGSQTRSFCYVSDLVEGIYRLAISDHHQPVNIGNPDEFTLLELAKIIVDITGAKSEIVFEPLPEDDPKQRRPDITKAKKLLGWKPEFQLVEGIKKTIDWYKV